MAFPDSFIQELCERSDIVDVVSGYVRLTKRSGANMFGLCPFHNEKTPSFSVSPDKQIYHCFGCGKGGSVIGFVMEMENLSFPEAVEFLARRAGMRVPEEKADPAAGRRERMLSLNLDAARFFRSMLLAEGGAPAREYIDRRGISGAMVTGFGLGYAPDAWSSLADAMRRKGYSDYELADAGLVRKSQKGGSVYDTFRSRLMFPVIDVRGSVIGFSGRIIGDGEPKYMNSPETAVFNKSRNLFALNLAKKSKSGYIILSEGNIDVVSLHQAGFDSAVASLGTSLTPEQARLISRYSDRVIIAYDNDEAGKKASQRAIGILENLDLNVRVLTVTGAKDPDEFIKKNGAEAFRALLDASEEQVEYRLGVVAAKYDLKATDGRVAFLREAANLIAALPGSVEREVYGMRAAEMAGVSAEAMAAEVRRTRGKLNAKEKQRLERENRSPAKAVQPQERGIRFTNERSAAAEKGVVQLLYNFPDLFKADRGLAREDFTSELLGRFYAELLRRARAGEPISMALLGEGFTGEELSCLSGILQAPLSPETADRALSDYIDKMRAEREKTTDEDFKTRAERLKAKKGQGG